MSEANKFQACQYKVSPAGGWKYGIAKVTDFGVCDVEYIVDIKTGNRLQDRPWNYLLVDGPLKYLDFGA